MGATLDFKGSVPENYERYSGGAVFEPYALDIVDRLKNDRINRVLELACGTGRVTNHLVKLLPTDGVLYATDISADMMAVAQRMVTDTRVKWQLVDAHELPFPDETFDHVVCQFGVMFFQDKPKVFREVCRVLEKGGRFIFNIWDAIEHNPRALLVKKVMEDLFDDVPEELTQGVHFFTDKQEITHLLQEAGFKNVKIDTVQKLTRYPHVDDVIQAVTTGSLSSAFLSTKSIIQQEQFKQVLRKELVAAYGETGLEAPMQALVCSAVKPSPPKGE
jgi:ubiquinone/menaquinone biosynthesis C-methylase UbiE